MPIKYESVVPWGRSYEEYVSMFGLSESDLNKFILGCGDGPAAFNCTMNKKGKRVVSVDLIYQLTKEEIEQRIKETFDIVMQQTANNLDKFIWSDIKSLEELGNIRLRAMKEFLEDYERGKVEHRYIYAELPHLPFENNTFDLALSSHFLFLYSDNLSLDFHIQSMNEMLCTANEVRIFPLLDINAVESPYVEKVIEVFCNKGYAVERTPVNYEFQKGGNRMLVIK